MNQTPNPYTQINALSRQAFAHWGAGRLDEAAEGFAAAITRLREDGLPASADLHAQLAAVLDSARRLDEAVAQSELALAAELAAGAADDTPSVKVARYFLADRLERQGRPQHALDVLAPSLAVLPDDWLLNTMQAEALFAAGRGEEAATAAQRAVANAPSDDKRAQLAERLAPVLRGES